MAHVHASPTSPAAGTLAHRLSSAVKGAWSAYWTWKAERATVHILSSLDDRALKDIGMDRSEIESVVYNRPRDCHADSNGHADRRVTMCA